MNRLPTQTAPAPSGVGEPDISLPRLIGEVYESAPPTLRASILEHLMRPLGILGLMAIANGVFAGIRLRSGLVDARVAPEEASAIEPGDVEKLADWVQQVSGDAIVGLSQLVSASPGLTKSAAAALLVSLLMQKAKNKRDRSQNRTEERRS
jgi:hypothetical protein